jgi:hypothetical protein
MVLNIIHSNYKDIKLEKRTLKAKAINHLGLLHNFSKGLANFFILKNSKSIVNSILSQHYFFAFITTIKSTNTLYIL